MLTERRKSDRTKMAQALVAIAQELGAKTELLDPAPLTPRGLWIEIEAPRGLCVTIELDGASLQPDTHVLSWHMSTDVDTCFSDEFWRVGSLNPYHWRKAASVCDGFEALCAILRSGLELAASGAAFSAEREAAAIAQAGTTAVQRNARFAAWRAELAATV